MVKIITHPCRDRWYICKVDPATQVAVCPAHGWASVAVSSRGAVAKLQEKHNRERRKAS